jgi:hypothetical protein
MPILLSSLFSYNQPAINNDYITLTRCIPFVTILLASKESYVRLCKIGRAFQPSYDTVPLTIHFDFDTWMNLSSYILQAVIRSFKKLFKFSSEVKTQPAHFGIVVQGNSWSKIQRRLSFVVLALILGLLMLDTFRPCGTCTWDESRIYRSQWSWPELKVKKETIGNSRQKRKKFRLKNKLKSIGCGGLHLAINIYFMSCVCLANYGASEADYPCVVVEKIHESF